ncbi:MAG: ribonuclease Z [Candidatus Nanoarchaeia archaeon]
MPEKMELTFLGTSDAIPTAERNHTSILLRYKEENILVDCGEGTQRQFRKAQLNIGKITRILITHWHGDHILGLPGILQSLALADYKRVLYIYGPKGTKKFVEEMQNVFKFTKNYKIEIKEVNGKFFETDDFYLESEAMTHLIPCNAYIFVKKGQIRIDKNLLKKEKIPSGPLLKRLKEGKDITYKGKKYSAKKLTFKEEDKKISFVLDTSFNKKIIPFVKNSDLLVCESTFSSELKDKAPEYGHLTSEEAAEIAKKSGSKKLILTHISQRYEKNKKKILDESKKIFKNSVLAEDLMGLEV